MVLKKENRFKISAKLVSQLTRSHRHTCNRRYYRSRRLKTRQSKTLGIVLNSAENTRLSNLIEFVSFTDDDQERYFTCEHKKGYCY